MLPTHLYVELREALEALEFGEAQPLLKPVTRGKHGRAYTLTHARMKAVEYANYQHGKGKSLILAETDVAIVLGIEHATVKSWSTRDYRAPLALWW